MLLIFLPLLKCVHSRNVQIQTNKGLGNLSHLWSSTGFSPVLGGKSHLKDVSIVNRLDNQLNVALIGSLPTGAIDQIRVHWLLDLMPNPLFNCAASSPLDQFMHLLWNYQLMPGFELMGNPGQFFRSNFTGKKTCN